MRLAVLSMARIRALMTQVVEEIHSQLLLDWMPVSYRRLIPVSKTESFSYSFTSKSDGFGHQAFLFQRAPIFQPIR